MQQKKLEFGETPWDNLSREELLLTIKKMYSALITSKDQLIQFRLGNESNPYWQNGGVGFRALEKIHQTLDSIHSDYNSGEIYRMYFKYANSILFNGVDIFGEWFYCPACKLMVNPVSLEQDHTGKICGEVIESRCNGVLKKFTLDDFEKLR